MTAVRRLAPAAATSAVVAVLLDCVYGPWFLNYDARYALLWAQDLWHGHTPEYTADFAPTPHPLQTAIELARRCRSATPRDDVLTFATLLAFGALVYLAFRLGGELFSPWVGLVAALVVLTRPAIERDALLGLPGRAVRGARGRRGAAGGAAAAARRAGARAARARRACCGRRRGCSPGLYLLWICGAAHAAPARALAVALVAAAPLIWAASDWVVTGDPLHSLHGTADLAIANDRRRSRPDSAVLDGEVLRLRAARAAGRSACRSGSRSRGSTRRRGGAAARGRGGDDGRVRDRPDLRAAADPPLHRARRPCCSTLFYGLAVAGWTMLAAAARARNRWMAAGVVAALLSVAYLPWHVDACSRRSSAALDRDGVLYGDLAAGDARRRAVRAAFAACAPLTAGDHRPIPYAASGSTARPARSRTVEGGASPMGKLLLMPRQGPDHEPHLPGRRCSRRSAARPARGRSTRTGRGACCAAPGCWPRLDVLHRERASSPTSRNSV